MKTVNSIGELKRQSSNFTKYDTFDATIDKLFAEELLEMNTKNRKPKDGAQLVMAQDMEKGQWAKNGETIRISETGVLLDGQNRLMTLLEKVKNASTTFQTIIVTGLEEASQSTMDKGVKRTLSDTLKIADEKNSLILAPALKLIYSFFVQKKFTAALKNQADKVSDATIEAWYAELSQNDLDLIKHYVSLAGVWSKKAKGHLMTSSRMAALAYIFHKKFGKGLLVERFFTTLTNYFDENGNGVGPNHESVVYFTVMEMERLAGINNVDHRFKQVGIFVNGFKLYINGNKKIGSPKHIKFIPTPEQPFPSL